MGQSRESGTEEVDLRLGNFSSRHPSAGGDSRAAGEAQSGGRVGARKGGRKEEGGGLERLRNPTCVFCQTAAGECKSSESAKACPRLRPVLRSFALPWPFRQEGKLNVGFEN